MWSQDFFLGIPYAQPPLGNLRFRSPQPINISYDGVLDASRYGYSCNQYGSNFNLSEDCLTLNVVRPAATTTTGANDKKATPLPVLVWIYGGGLTAGSTADPQYNISGIVATGSTTANPFIGVSINYRLGIWGFLQSPLIVAEGSSNAGLLDQRLAFQWIQENIAAFGGDPSRVTVWGESAGAQSLGLHLHSYGGRNDGLYSSAILESGGPVGTNLEPLAYYNPPYQNFSKGAGCSTTWTSAASLACLRNLTSEEVFNVGYTVTWNPIVDGVFLTDYPSNLAAAGDFVHVPLLIGANTDEGISFNPSTAVSPGANTDADLAVALSFWRNYALTPPAISKLLELYPPGFAGYPPYNDTTNNTYASTSRGLQYRRGAAIGGDLVMIAQRRKTALEFVKGGVSHVYSYRFDTPLWNASAIQQPVSVYHFVNVVFSFQNISGALGPLPQYQSYKDLSLSIGKAYANFVGTHNPNGGAGVNDTGLPHWPEYTGKTPTNMVLNSNGSWVEPDTFRAAGIDYINTIDLQLLA